MSNRDSVAPAALDRAALDELTEMTGGDAAFLAELVDTFFADGQILLDEMAEAMAGGDAATLRRAAHTLKSNSRTFGATALSDLCQELEGRAAAGELGAVSDLIERVGAEYPAVVAALQAELAAS